MLTLIIGYNGKDEFYDCVYIIMVQYAQLIIILSRRQDG